MLAAVCNLTRLDQADRPQPGPIQGEVRMIRTVAAVALAAALLLPAQADAGIKNVQSALAADAEPGVSGSASASLDWRTGNVSFLSINLAGSVVYRKDKNLVIGIASADRKSSKGNTIIERTFEHVRYRYLFSDRILGETFVQHEYDGLKRLNIRALFGAGPRVTLYDGDRSGVAFGVAYMLEYEELSVNMEADSGDTDLAHRASSYLVGQFERDQFQLVETLYVQPRLTDASDVRLLSESSVAVRLTKRLNMTTTFVIAYDSETPIGVEDLDTALKTSLTLQF